MPRTTTEKSTTASQRAKRATTEKDNPNKKRKQDKKSGTTKVIHKEILEELLCPICSSPLSNPSTSPCGHNFCMECIQKARLTSLSCPVCRETFIGWIPQVNFTLRSIVERQEIQCPFENCHTVVSLKESETHKDVCIFRPIKCPNKGCSESYLYSEENVHGKVCLFTPCDSLSRGCPFRGSVDEVLKHHENCTFEKNKFLLDLIRSDMKKMVDSSVANIMEKLGAIDARLDALSHQVFPHFHSDDEDSDSDGDDFHDDDHVHHHRSHLHLPGSFLQFQRSI